MTRRLLALVLVSITIIASAIVLATRRTPDRRLVAILPEADGLREGMTITYLGIEIGVIERLHIGRRPVVAEIRITRPDAQLRRGDNLRIRSSVFGDKTLEIVQGTDSTPVLADGDTISFSPARQPSPLDAVKRAIALRAVDRIPASEIGAALAGAAPDARGVVFPGSRDDHAQYVFHRRAVPSEVEQHDAWDDILAIYGGRGFIRHGGTWENSTLIYQGERRGGTLTDPQEVAVGAGDVIRIPAGEPHRIVPDGDSPLTYLVLKVRVNRGTNDR